MIDYIRLGFLGCVVGLCLSCSGDGLATGRTFGFHLREDVIANGVPGEMIVDTGANQSFVTPEFASRIGAEIVGQSVAIGISGVVNDVDVVTFSLDYLGVFKPVVRAKVSPLFDGTDGLIGIPELRDGTLIVNFAEEFVTLSTDPIYLECVR